MVHISLKLLDLKRSNYLNMNIGSIFSVFNLIVYAAHLTTIRQTVFHY